MPTVETVRFRFRPEVDEATRDAALAASSRFLAEQPGFQRRVVARRDGGEWLDLVEWDTRPDALVAAAAFSSAEAASPFNESLESGSVTMDHVDVVHRHERWSLADILVRDLETARLFFERTTSVLTDEHEGFRPCEGMFTVAQQVAHTASTVDWLIEGAFSPDGFDMDFEAHNRWLAEQRSLAAAREHLAGAFERAKARFGSVTVDEILQPLPPGPVMGGKPRRAVVSGVQDHTAHHRGSLAVYARLLGLVPPMPYGDA